MWKVCLLLMAATVCAAGELELMPLFASCGYYYESEVQDKIDVYFRQPGKEWRKGFPPVRIEGKYRGSIVNLQESCDYELKLSGAAGETLAAGKFRTWDSQVPVAKTIVLDANNFKGNIKISDHGKPDGWIRYTAAPGFVLTNDHRRTLLEVINAAYVIIDGMTLKGGLRHAISINDSEFIRVVNCDISDWGRIGKQRFDLSGKYYQENGKAINWDCGIWIGKSHGTVVERCYIHDPRGRTNSWLYSHPAGTQGIGINKPTSTVIRYNDIVGSDDFRWNDGIEGVGNFHADGGFNKDADIYGNFIIYSNDDSIELDGGQQNVRCFHNRFENSYCGISIQGCMTGPSYVFGNVVANMSDEFGAGAPGIKNSSRVGGKDAVSFIFNNTLVGTGSGTAMLNCLRVVVWNNVFSDNHYILKREVSPQSECGYNLLPSDKHGLAETEFTGKPILDDLYRPLKGSPVIGRGRTIDNFTAPEQVDLGAVQSASPLILPYRPMLMELDKAQLDFKDEVLQRTVTAEIPGNGSEITYEVRKNRVFNWFEVTPESGTLRGGEKVTFKVKIKPELMKERSVYRGAFLVRLPNGLSRPVSVYAYTNNEIPARPAKEGSVVIYRDAAKPDGGYQYPVVGDAIHLAGKSNTNPVVYHFDVPRDGKYFILVRIRCDEPVGSHNSIFCAIDDEPMAAAHLRGKNRWVWALTAPGNYKQASLKLYDLKRGRHTIKIAPRESLYLEAIAITDDPKIFEER